MNYSARGITLIELLVVVALIGLISIPIIFNVRQAGGNQSLRSSSQVLSNDLQVVKNASRDAKNQKAWGIISDSSLSTYKVVSGTSSSFTVDQMKSLDKGISFKSPFAVWFQIGSGELPSGTTITLVNLNGRTSTLDINTQGVINITEK